MSLRLNKGCGHNTGRDGTTTSFGAGRICMARYGVPPYHLVGPLAMSATMLGVVFSASGRERPWSEGVPRICLPSDTVTVSLRCRQDKSLKGPNETRQPPVNPPAAFKLRTLRSRAPVASLTTNPVGIALGGLKGSVARYAILQSTLAVSAGMSEFASSASRRKP